MKNMKKRVLLFVTIAAVVALTVFIIIYFAKINHTSVNHTVPEIAVTSTDTPEATERTEKTDFSIASPSGNLQLHIKLDDQGMVSYTVTGENHLTVLNQSYIGLNTETCDFSSDLTFVRQIPAVEFDETYANLSGKKSSVRNHYHETVLVLEKDSFFFDIYFRAYDDGFAYRFAIRAKDETPQELTVIAETGNFAIPAKSTITAQRVTTLTSSFNYENSYSTVAVESLSKNASQFLCFPALVDIADAEGEKSGQFILLSEADLVSDSYCGSLLNVQGNNIFGMNAAPKVSRNRPTIITTDFTSPWRFGIYGAIGDIVESDLAENLSPAPEGDYSWVVPGVTAWMWLSEGYDGQRSECIIKDYVDLAAEMGWKYLILDEGWQPHSSKSGRAYDSYFDDFDDLVQYADNKDVGFIVWVKYMDLDTPEEREILREWAAKGVKGIKADFFDSEDQTTMADFKAIYELCAECHLLVNCHGAGKPTGERRTYPNVINREAVNGEEFGGFWINDAVIWAYTRNVVGPMDITPRLFPTAKSGNTLAAQLACNIIFESGMPCMAGDSEDYRGFHAASFYQDLPAVWDDTKFIGGTVGDNVTIARKTGENWYAAALTLSAKTGQSMPLSFLEEGEYEAVIYSDKSKKEVSITTQTVTKNDTLTYDMQRQSGYVVKFFKKGSEQ